MKKFFEKIWNWIKSLFGWKTWIEPSKIAKLEFFLTDAPAIYDSVNIDVQELKINHNENWIDIPLEKKGIFNLLEFRNGMGALLGSIELPAGKITEMRMVLGEGNNVVVDGKTYAMKVPSGSASGLKFKLEAEIKTDISYRFWIDFDSAKSIHKTGNGRYQLKPVIKAFGEDDGGTIKGIILPIEDKAIVDIIGINDSFGALPDETGYFLVKGVPEGKYVINITPDITGIYEPLTIPEVSVLTGIITNLGTITLTEKPPIEPDPIDPEPIV